MTQNTSTNLQQSSSGSSGFLVLFAWLFVGLPLLWGISQTVMQSIALFKSTH